MSFTRECLAIDVAGSIRSARVIDVLGQVVSLHGAPRYLRSDNGPEFIATALLRWLQTAKIDTAFHRSGQALAEWHGRIVQRESSGTNACPSSGFRNRMEATIGIETLAAARQRRAPPHESRRPHPRRVQGADRGRPTGG